jgi:radical SAM protein with 4Fe4S-binding SPASM domain
MAQGRMKPDEFRKSLDFIIDQVFPRMGVGQEHFLTVEFLGGEVLLIPEDELTEVVEYTRERLKPLVRGYRDGAQSNLIGAPRRVLFLHDLFDGNLGTSWDNHTGQRHIHGSADLYRGLLNRSLKVLGEQRHHLPGRVLVLDAASAPHIESEVRDAIQSGYDLVLRPVFMGGSSDVHQLTPEKIANILAKCYDIWRLTPNARIEPFYSLHTRRAGRGKTDTGGNNQASQMAGCPFQSDCAFRSLSLDPDGTLHICQEMADSSNYPLGNALLKTFDHRTWRLLARRVARLSNDCVNCEWKDECGGGCMNEAIQTHGDPFAKTELCPAWKAIFRRIENDIRDKDIGNDTPDLTKPELT